MITKTPYSLLEMLRKNRTPRGVIHIDDFHYILLKKTNVEENTQMIAISVDSLFLSFSSLAFAIVIKRTTVFIFGNFRQRFNHLFIVYSLICNPVLITYRSLVPG